MVVPLVPFWKKAPFTRLLFSFAAGIVFQWYVQAGTLFPWMVSLGCVILLGGFFFLGFFRRYRLSFLPGIAVYCLFASIGSLLVWYNDPRHHFQWFENQNAGQEATIAVLDEPPVEKPKSLKSNARVVFIKTNQGLMPVTGKIIIYFKKDSLSPYLPYGTRIIFKKPLQEIKNSGNPGSFDYKRYSLFQGITHQVYLEPGEYITQTTRGTSKIKPLIYDIRARVLDILRRYIKGEKELGLAEALLIGYKNDLDRDLVQSYANTGVVHVIAISGLHVGLIYWILLLLLKPLRQHKLSAWLHALLVISGLWLFSLLAGAQPSVLRSALMFSCLVLGECVSRKTSFINTLAFSAFILLCINPFWLWDTGFQLSYTAVLSIVLFMKPIYNWFFFTNKIVDYCWKLNAVTLSAQLLTVPLTIYYFHQFPNYFLLTNFVAVPLSSLILLGEIIICVFSWMIAPVSMLGELISGTIRWLNKYIENIEKIPFAVWDSLQLNSGQAILLLMFISSISYWLMEQAKAGFKLALLFLLSIVLIRTVSMVRAGRQHKIIVYNVPKKSAIDFIYGQEYFFAGHPSLGNGDPAGNFFLKPARTLNRVHPSKTFRYGFFEGNCFVYQSKRILWLNKPIAPLPVKNKQTIDLVIVSGNPRISINRLAEVFNLKQIVFDASNAAGKVKRWKQDCDSLGILCHDVTVKGAFVMTLR